MPSTQATRPNNPHANPAEGTQAADLQTLLQRLRQAAHALQPAHTSPALGATPATARPWAPAWGGTPQAWDADAKAWRQAVQAYVVRRGGLLLWLCAQDDVLPALYQRVLKRPADETGLRDGRTALQRGTPRLELWARMQVGPEARALQPGALTLAWAWLWVVLCSPRWPLARLVRPALRVLERAARRYITDAGLAALHALQPAWAAQARQAANLSEQLQDARGALADLAQQGQPSAPVQQYLAALEDAFRGDAEALAAQMEADYLHHVMAARDAACAADPAAAQAPCIDIGCGRGSWLRLLRAKGLVVRGVDHSANALAQAQAHGLDVVQADALQWLQAQPAGQALVVSAFHVMEHLTLAQRLQLLRECVRVLRPGGLLLLETPNPENIYVATHTFHHDPTHTQPLTPDGLAFMVRYHGLEVIDVPRLHPYPPEAAVPGTDATTQRLNGLTCIGQDFAVVARKPLQAPHA